MSLVVDVKEDDNDEKGDIPLPNTTPLPLHRRATWEVVEKEDNNDEFGLSAFEMTKRSVTSAPSVMAFGLNNNNLKDEDSTIVKNKSHSVKRSILNKFMPITFTLLSLVALCTITIVFFSNRFILNQTYAMLRDQYSRYGGIIAQSKHPFVVDTSFIRILIEYFIILERCRGICRDCCGHVVDWC